MLTRDKHAQEAVVRADSTSRHVSPCVARHLWRRRGVSPCRGRAHRLHRREPLRGLRVPLDSSFSFDTLVSIARSGLMDLLGLAAAPKRKPTVRALRLEISPKVPESEVSAVDTLSR